MFKMTSEAEGYAKYLGTLPGGALQKATARTLNAISLGAESQQRKNVETMMIVRTPYTVKSLKRYQASETRPIQKQNAVVGSTSPYLPVHDDGGTVRASKKRIPIPTNAIRGSDRKKKIPTGQRIQAMNLGGKETKFFVLKSGIYYRKGAALGRQHWNRQRGLERAFGASSPSKVNRPMVKVRDLSKSQIKLKPNRWHSAAVLKYAKFNVISGVFVREAKKLIPGE